jgi:O-acetyl-ADP-ribose deacetylase (regulator of RNase III)
VCGAIFAAAGNQLEEACQAIGHCPTGKVVITPGFKLKTAYIIHAVGPRWQGGNQHENDLLESCYRHIFEIAKEKKIKSISLPAN